MLFSVNYKSKHLKEADEIRCPYNQLGQIYSLIKEHPEKRYLITIPRDTENLNKAIEQASLVKSITPNYTLRTEGIEHLLTLLKENLNAYYSIPVTDWELFQDLRFRNVSDIFIDGPLCFQTDKIKEAKGNSVIRISPTFSPNATLTPVRNPSSFYVRPEDLSLYSALDPIIDFCANDQEREDTLFNIYKRGTFNYDLGFLIPGLPKINNLLFRQEFAEHRLNCGQRCKIPSKTCHYCNTYWSVADKTVQLFSQRREKERD